MASQVYYTSLQDQPTKGIDLQGFKLVKKHFPCQSLKRFTFCVKLSDSIFFLLGLSHIVNQFDIKIKCFFCLLRGKYCLIYLENCEDT